jgi:hypothetical protein
LEIGLETRGDSRQDVFDKNATKELGSTVVLTALEEEMLLHLQKQASVGKQLY